MDMNASDFAKLKTENRLRSEYEYSKGEVSLKSLPRVVFVELTQGCNLQCAMCRPRLIPHHSRRMPEALFNQVASQLFPTAELVDLRGWGESLILPEVVDRIAVARHFGAKVRVVSNFSFRRDHVLDELVQADAMIDVSLDTSDEAILKKVREGSRLDLISKNIRYVVDRYGHSRNIRILATVQKSTISTLPMLIEFAAEHGIHNVSLSSVTAGKDSPLGIHSEEAALDQVLEHSKRKAIEHQVELIAMTKLGSLPNNPEGIPPCIHPWSYCYIAYNGDVGFCDHLIGPSAEEYYIGNIVKTNFDSIWNGSSMKRNRREHLVPRRPDAPQFSHCAWCYQNKFIDFENELDTKLESQVVRLT